jgi:hypothetical protein
MKQLPLLIFLVLLIEKGHTQWSVQTALGFATETNLGDSGLRLSSKLSRSIGKHFKAYTQLGTFQMFHSNEHWEGDAAYQELRSLSTVNLDLGGGIAVVHKSRVCLDLLAGGSYRAGRQLWPETAVTINGHRDIYYTYEKISDFGYALGLELCVKVTERIWLGMDANCHNYNYLGEYLGAGLGATFQL